MRKVVIAVMFFVVATGYGCAIGGFVWEHPGDYARNVIAPVFTPVQNGVCTMLTYQYNQYGQVVVDRYGRPIVFYRAVPCR